MTKARIQIVEDEAIVAMEIESQLKSLGYEVTSIVDTGEKAIEKAEAGKPDLILMDIRLEGKIDEVEATGVVRSRFNIPVVFLIAQSEDAYLEKAKLIHPYGYLVKPVRDQDLKITLEMALYSDKLEKNHKELEQKLEQSERRYRELVEAANSIVMKFDPDGNITFINQYAQAFFGFDEEEILGKNIVGTILPKSESTGRDLENMIKEVLKTPDDYVSNENENSLKNGERVWVDWSNKGITDEDGNLIELLCMGHDITKRKKYEAALKKSEERFALAQKSANMGTWNWDMTTNLLEWSETIESIFGFNQGEFKQTYDAFVEIVHPEDREFVSQSVNSALASEKEYDIDHRIVWPDGTIRWVRETGSVFQDETGKPVRMLGIVQDITPQKTTQLALEDQTLILQTVLDSIEESAFLIDTEGKILFANRTVAQRLNTTTEQIVGSNAFDLLPPDLAKSRLEKINETIKTKQRMTFEDVRDDYFLESSLFPILNSNQEVETICVLSIDITQKRKNEADLRILWKAIEQSPSSIVITDKTGNITYVNPGLCQTTGYSLQEAIGQNPRILKSGQHDASFYKEMWSTISSGKIWQGEICNRKKDGSLFWEQASISPVVNEDGKISHYIAVKDDISERKELDRLKEDIEQIMRHDLKTPLNAIIGYPQLLLKSNLTERQQKMIEQMHTAGNSMLQIINSYLDMTKMEAGTYELNPIPLDLIGILKRVMDDLQSKGYKGQAELKLTVNHHPINENDLISVIGEEILCYSLFSNLVKNAVEATPEYDVVLINILPHSSAVDIIVSNKGVVPEEIKERFFEKYVTAGKRGGTGLGTYSAKLMAETQEGSVAMQSSEEQGTIITVTMPA